MATAPLDFDLREQLQKHLGATYRVEEELRGGGSAKVFLATETALERRVVVKVLAPDVSRGVDAERFRREILFVAKLQHPHLVPLLNAGTVKLDNGGELRWFTMPFVEGQTLRELLQRKALLLSDILRLLRELSSALAYAHARGIVHRDIKPENMLLSEGVSMIADFGVAKAIDNAAALGPDGKRVTTTSTILGTPAYMAPEQILSATVVDHKADLYAFGCVAYELLTGDPPLLRESLRATLAAQVSDAPVPLSEKRPDLSPALTEVIMRCLEKDPNRRLASASAIVKALDELTQSAHLSGSFTAVRAVPAAAAASTPNTSTPTASIPAAAAVEMPAVPLAPSPTPSTPANATAMPKPSRTGAPLWAYVAGVVLLLVVLAWLKTRG
jgi:eukaryotic-like serine/threonine-protein kinase